MNKFILEPTDENLERLKKIKGTKVYWHTADFFRFDSSIRDELSIIFDDYMDIFFEWKPTDKNEFSIARMIVKAARKNKISPQDYRDQFENYITVIWTPVCLWRKDEFGKISYSLKSNL
ncbi:hypothetical protein [Geminocystis sp.]|uniref:hypothetical protein n=1 Tax=Geminocystis sp. TaxID=2664100 RepID=UPI003593C417